VAVAAELAGMLVEHPPHFGGDEVVAANEQPQQVTAADPTTVDSSTIGMLRTSYSSIAWARSAALAFARTYEGGGNGAE